MNEIEQQFINQLKSGNNNAYRRLYKDHYNVLCHVAYRYVQDFDMAENIVEDVIVHLWEKREQLNICISIRSYLLAAVRNHCLNYLEQRERQQESYFSHLSVEELREVTIQIDSHLPLEEAELVRLISDAIDRLPEENRQVFLLSRQQEMSYQQIAQRLGISVNTVKYHIKQSLVHLRKDLGPYLTIVAFMMHI